MRTRAKSHARARVRPANRFSDRLLEALNGSTIGLAIYDRGFHYVGVNSAIAAMNGEPPEEHLGRTPPDVVGGASKLIEPHIDRVFRTGQPIFRHEFSAQLPRRTDSGHWIQDYFPIRDERDRVNQVGISVVEVTKERRLGALIHRLHRLISGETAIGDEKSLVTLNRPVESRDTAASSNLTQAIRFDSPALQAPVDVLSARELEVLTLLANAKNNKEVASLLSLSEKTVATHRASIKAKLRLNSLVELTHYAIRHRIVEP